MAGLTLFSGNRLESLAGKFSKTIKEFPLSPMTGELVVVQSIGMMKWLSMTLAENLGIWGNWRYLFPNALASKIMESFFPGSGDERFFDKDVMTFKIMNIISNPKSTIVSPDIKGYISNDPSGLKLYQISSRIADTFDQYITFRPEMILDWDRGNFSKDDWQPLLWNELTASIDRTHPPGLLEKLFDSLKDPKFKPATSLPSRITVFGISYIPLYHINVLRGASLFSDVSLYILNPSDRYWGDILREKEKTKIISRTPVKADDPLELHLDSGNTLLASMGRVGRDFFHYIVSSDIVTEEDFFEPLEHSLLGKIQYDIFNLINRGVEPPESFHEFTTEEISADNSLVINSCHSNIRELEVLRDYLLDAFNNDPTLEPGHILVMTPDIESYADYIEAVFESETNSKKRIPYSIADRKVRAQSPSVEMFFKILDLEAGRFTSAEVLSFLENEYIGTKFALTEDDIVKLAGWADDTRIYWGVDGKWKAGLGLPSCEENTWQAGINRMITGFLVQSRGELCMDVLPYAGIEGADALVLGRFISFFNSLVSVSEILKKSMDTASWANALMEIVTMLFEEDGDIPEELFPVYEALEKLKELPLESDSSGEIGLAVIKSFLEKSMSGVSSANNFINGKVTFCEMLIMRSIPFRIICLIGMNSQLFPRKSRAPGFDLIAKNPKRGDRSVRDEDRYLFLETLISAREKLYISYTGQNVRTNEEMNPSIVVSELIDYIEQGYGLKSNTISGKKSLKDFIIKKQKLQPFNSEYFSGSDFYSYNESALKNAKLSFSPRKEGQPFFNEIFPDIINEKNKTGIDEFVNFFVNPSRTLLFQRLGIGLDPGEMPFQEEELFVLNGLDRYIVDTNILRALELGLDMNDYYKILCSEGILPHASPGWVFYLSSLKEQRSFYEKLYPYIKKKDEDILLLVKAGGLEISGKVKSLYNGKSIFYRSSSIKPRDMLRAWISHLLLSASGNVECETIIFGRDEEFFINPVSEKKSMEYLEELVSLYFSGMRSPLKLFEKSSFVYAKEFYTASSEPSKAGMKKAYTAFHGDFNSPGDIDDYYVNRLFAVSGYSPDREFVKNSLSVYGPVYDNSTGGGSD